MASLWLLVRVSVRNGPAHTLRLPGPVCLVGRSRGAQVRLLAPEVSGAHLRLRVREAGLSVEDLGSANGTRLDGVSLGPGVPRPLPEGGALEVGPYVIRPSLLAETPRWEEGLEGTATLAGRLLVDLIAAGAAPAATVQVTSPGGVQHRCVLGPGRVLRMGRDPGCDIGSGDPDLSRHHAEIRQVISGAVLEDLGSKNGTWRKEERLVGSVSLRSGDRIRLGGTELVYEDLGELWLRELEEELGAERGEGGKDPETSEASLEERAAGLVPPHDNGASQELAAPEAQVERVGARTAGPGSRATPSSQGMANAEGSLEARSESFSQGIPLATMILVGIALVVMAGAFWALWQVFR